MIKIIGLIDGSIYAQSVCDHIAWIAGRSEVSVDILHVIGRRDLSTEPVNLSGNIGLGARTALLKELAELDAQKARTAQHRGRLLLEEAKARLQAVGIDRVNTMLRNGDLAETLQELEESADLIVIGKRGEGADFAQLHLGSNLERVVRSSHKMIAIASRAFKPIRKVLIAYDGGAMAMKAVDYISGNPMFAGLSIKLVTVGDDTPEARQALIEGKLRFMDAGVPVESAIFAGQPDKAISDIVEREAYDLLMMGAYSHSRLRALFIGSTTTEMIRACKVPVLIFR
ncbi:universal stress protein [Agrobacterium vitis]|uniref:Universal stress protein n=1 Tax=Agrobacterium vitis TaxID=373 RepID=A0A368NZT3_AGRVI|nr:universal stress protein [Agrobacterium vitis]KAA3510754.1 universal stress protein [Agrobacterium vitis]KAA3528015.1 universal stress protein [Agrobacterium vitis]MCF1478568.1 universal stress protein [Agrobacterium vitis]MUZ96729.1 universal stress protein [Agrobacterium vitis]MVA28418.1 universal stress protein [Agrobacterium vitis]